MKKKYYTIFGCVLLASMLTACVEQYDVYDYPHDRLGFAYETDPSGPGHKDSIRRFSFVYMDQAVVSDTVRVRMETSGFLSDSHRPFMVEQIYFFTMRTGKGGIRCRPYSNAMKSSTCWTGHSRRS
jgi:hypothetical protein